jgi:hypothetical protein
MSSRNPCPDWNPHNATDANYGLNIPNSVCKRDACPYLRGVTNRGLCWFCRYTDEDGERFLRAGPNRPEERRSDLVTTDVPDTPSASAAGSASSAAGASGAATVAPLGGALIPAGHQGPQRRLPPRTLLPPPPPPPNADTNYRKYGTPSALRPCCAALLRNLPAFAGLNRRAELEQYHDIGWNGYSWREFHLELGRLGGDIEPVVVEQLMHWAVHVAGSDKSMGCQERGQRNNFKHTHCTGRWRAPPGALGAQMIRNSIYAHHGTNAKPFLARNKAHIMVKELAPGQSLRLLAGYLAKYKDKPDWMMWVHGWSEKEVMESIAEYTRVARSYYQDALTLNKGNLFNEVWNFTNRFLLPLVPEGLTWIEALRFMLMHPIEKIQLSSVWGQTSQFHDMVKTQMLFHWAFLLPGDREDIITCSQLAYIVCGRSFLDENYLFWNAADCASLRASAQAHGVDTVHNRPLDEAFRTPEPSRFGRVSRYEAETQWWFQGMTAAGKAPWLSSTNNGERNKHFASMSWSEVETHIMNKQGAAAEAKIAACAVAARANNTAIQGPAVVSSGSTWMWGAVRTAQAAGIPYRHDFHGTPPGSPSASRPGSPSASLNGSTTSTPTRSITSSPTPSASYQFLSIQRPRI